MSNLHNSTTFHFRVWGVGVGGGGGGDWVFCASQNSKSPNLPSFHFQGRGDSVQVKLKSAKFSFQGGGGIFCPTQTRSPSISANFHFRGRGEEGVFYPRIGHSADSEPKFQPFQPTMYTETN